MTLEDKQRFVKELAEEAAQMGYDNWVVRGEGELSESVEDRCVEVDGVQIDVEE